MNSARSILSPTKENNLPATRGSPTKFDKGQLAEILFYLKENGIKLPPHLSPTKNPEGFSLKLHSTDGSSKNISEAKTLKIKLSDTEFELKKLEEDFAQYKRTVKAEKEKEQKKFQESLQRLKEDSKQNNEDYDFAIENKNKQNQAKIEKLRAQSIQKMQKLEKQLTLKHAAELSKIQHKTANQRESQEIQFNKKYSNLHKELTQQIEALKKEFERQKHNINLRNTEKLDQVQKRFESTTLALQSQKKTQEKLHEKTKVDAQREKQKLFGELCYERNVKRNLQEEVAAKNQQIKDLKEKVHELKIQLEIVKENAEQQKKWLAKQHQKNVQNVHQKYEQKIRKMLQSHTSACEKYQKRIQKMNHLHKESQRLHEENLSELSLKFQQRLSKPQDLQEIKKLTNTLTRKDQEIRKLTNQLRYRNLEIQNKQQVYNKIFKSSTRMREQRKMAVSINKCEYPIPKLERESWSKESLFRKSQTTDVKVLLQNIGSISKTKREKTTNKDE